MVPFVMRVISDPVLDKKESGLWDEIVIVAKVSDRGHVLYLLFTGWCIYWKHSEPSWRRLRLTRPKDLGKTWLLRLCNIFMIPPWKSTFYGLYPLPPPIPLTLRCLHCPWKSCDPPKKSFKLPHPTPPRDKLWRVPKKLFFYFSFCADNTSRPWVVEWRKTHGCHESLYRVDRNGGLWEESGRHTKAEHSLYAHVTWLCIVSKYSATVTEQLVRKMNFLWL